jgi:hypothetical protein
LEAILMGSAQNTNLFVVNTERRGAKVLAKLHDGSLVERLVWDEDHEEGVVYLCTESIFSRLSGGDETARPVGFPSDSISWPGEK